MYLLKCHEEHHVYCLLLHVCELELLLCPYGYFTVCSLHVIVSHDSQYLVMTFVSLYIFVYLHAKCVAKLLILKYVPYFSIALLFTLHRIPLLGH